MAVVRGDADAYIHAWRAVEWDSAARPVVLQAAGLHATELDGSPLRYNRPDPYLPDADVPPRRREPLAGRDVAGQLSTARTSPRVVCVRSWPAVETPQLPGRGPQLRLYDSADRRVRPTAPGQTATMYVCGITPTTPPPRPRRHPTWPSAWSRVWLVGGHRVHYVQNVTDVDDPLFERAARDGVDWRDLGAQVKLFREDMTALRVLPPHDYVGATEAIAGVVETSGRCWPPGAAYVVEERRVSRRVLPRTTPPSSSATSRLRPRCHNDALFAERGGDPDRPGKGRRNRRAAVARRASRRAEPWPVAVRRPGRAWHVECAAISLSRIGSGLDVRGGGSDLIFPHHGSPPPPRASP